MTKKHKKMSASLVVREIQTKARRRYHDTVIALAKNKTAANLSIYIKSSCITGGSEQVHQKVKTFFYLAHFG